MYYIFVIACFLVSMFMAGTIIPRVLLISFKKKLFDEPDERKVHETAVPRLGGVSFFPTILFSICFVFAIRYLTGFVLLPTVNGNEMLPELLLFCCGLTLLYLIGIMDDLIGVRYRLKLLIQILSASLLPLSGLWINDLYGFMGIHALPIWLGIPFTVLTIVFITNAINLIDGIDGLASGLSIVSLSVFSFLFISNGLFTYAMITFACLGVLAPFFYYNVFGNAERGRKIFMGDTGSLTLGYILSFMAIRYIRNDPAVMPYNEGAFVIAFTTLLIPALDVIRVVLLRARSGNGLFLPDKNHIHHKFLAMGFTARRAMISIIAISCLFSVANIILVSYINSTLLIITDIVIWVGLNVRWDSRMRRKRLVAQAKEENCE
jgi:UDP-N-acetylmuramyl pentapeptide phosphotransferase/UDP-N-acetylglucosamine-1-phosphate transferase